MAYEKPELLVLSVAANAVRSTGDDGGGSDGTKGSTHIEGTLGDTDVGGTGTSSTSGAYEADE